MPIVSVIIPVHNAGSYIKDSLACLLNQDLWDYEIILVDDGSTDDSVRTIEAIVGGDNRFRLVKQKNQGAGTARNVGLHMAGGQYLAFLDADDLFNHAMLSSMVEALESSGADICICEADCCDSNGHSLGSHIRFPKTIQERVYTKREINDSLFQVAKNCPWNKLYRTSFIQGLGIEFQEVSNCNDFFFVGASLASCNTVYFIKQPYVIYRVGAGGSLQDCRAKDPVCPILAAEKLWGWVMESSFIDDTELPSIRAWCGTLVANSVEQAILSDRLDDVYPMAKALLKEWDVPSLDFGLFPGPSAKLAVWAVSNATVSGIQWAYGEKDISRFGTKVQKATRAARFAIVGLSGFFRSKVQEV